MGTLFSSEENEYFCRSVVEPAIKFSASMPNSHNREILSSLPSMHGQDHPEESSRMINEPNFSKEGTIPLTPDDKNYEGNSLAIVWIDQEIEAPPNVIMMPSSLTTPIV